MVGWDHVERMHAEFSPVSRPQLTVDALGPVDANLRRVRALLEG